MEELLLNELDSNFKYRIVEKMGDGSFMNCFACGSCTASCPVRHLNEQYNPRRLVRMAILGMKEEVYRSEFVWLCSYHSTCLNRCPQGVNIGEVCNAVVQIKQLSRMRLRSEQSEAPSRAERGNFPEEIASGLRPRNDEGGGRNDTSPDKEFRDEVVKFAPGVSVCFVCGSCTAVCPEALLDPKKDPRRFIRKVNLGLEALAFEDEFKEVCATHFRCESRCPQGVRISKLMQALKELAIEDGYSYPESLKVLERVR